MYVDLFLDQNAILDQNVGKYAKTRMGTVLPNEKNTEKCFLVSSFAFELGKSLWLESRNGFFITRPMTNDV